MKFNLDNLEKKINNITNISKNIQKSMDSDSNKEKILFILRIFFKVYEYDFNIEKKKYLETISRFSPNYLIGSEWYIGEEYTHQHYYDSLDQYIKYKMFLFLFMMSSFYNMC